MPGWTNGTRTTGLCWRETALVLPPHRTPRRRMPDSRPARRSPDRPGTRGRTALRKRCRPGKSNARTAPRSPNPPWSPTVPRKRNARPQAVRKTKPRAHSIYRRRSRSKLSSTGQRHADALVDIAEHYLANGPNRRRRTGQRYEVVLTIGRNELAKQSAAGGASYHVDRDWGVDEEDARQIACDADLTEFVQDAHGNLLNYERRRRIVPARLMRALKLRDHDRCRFPGCPHQRHVEAHHIRHWIDGGETRLDNLVLLCSAHHRLLHHGAFHVTVEDGDVVFVSRDGEVIEPALQPQFADVSAGVSEETLAFDQTVTGRVASIRHGVDLPSEPR